MTWTRMLTVVLTTVSLAVLAATGWAAEIQISPSSPATGKPVTFTVTNCVDCFDFVWEFEKIDDASVVDGGDGETITKTLIRSSVSACNIRKPCRVQMNAMVRFAR